MRNRHLTGSFTHASSFFAYSFFLNSQKSRKRQQNVESTAACNSLVEFAIVHERRANRYPSTLRESRHLLGEFLFDFSSDLNSALDFDDVSYTWRLYQKVNLKSSLLAAFSLQHERRSRTYRGSLKVQMRNQRKGMVDHKTCRFAAGHDRRQGTLSAFVAKAEVIPVPFHGQKT